MLHRLSPGEQDRERGQTTQDQRKKVKNAKDAKKPGCKSKEERVGVASSLEKQDREVVAYRRGEVREWRHQNQVELPEKNLIAMWQFRKKEKAETG